MEKQEAITDFLRSFKALLNISTLYSKNHPYFLKPAQELIDRANILFGFMDPVAMVFAPTSFMLEGKLYEKGVFCAGIAEFMHSRKVKSIEFNKGVTAQELISFMGVVAMRPKELFRSGGVSLLLRQEPLVNLKVEELEYSQLLRGQGQEVKDAWAYLLQRAVESNDPAQVKEAAEFFPGVIRTFKLNEILKDEQLKQNLSAFMSYLKGNDVEKFGQCNQALLKTVLSDKEPDSQANLQGLKALLRECTSEDYAKTLIDGCAQSSGMDNFNVELFSLMMDQKGHEATARILGEELKDAKKSASDPLVYKNLMDLFSVSSDSTVSNTYRSLIMSMAGQKIAEEGFRFDREQLFGNYAYILLSLLYQEKDAKNQEVLLEKISQAYRLMVERKDWHYLKALIDDLKGKKEQSQGFAQIAATLEQGLRDFLEERILCGDLPEDKEYFFGFLKGGTKKAEYYVDKIFVEGNASPQMLGLFFMLFPEHSHVFFAALQEKAADMDFMEHLIAGLVQADSAIALQALTRMYGWVNEIIKLEILRAMQQLATYNESFLLTVIEGGTFDIQREAFSVMRNNESMRSKVLAMFTGASCGWGKKNEAVARNLDTIVQLGLHEALPYVTKISKAPFFWNREIRKKAREALGRLG